MWFDFLYNNDEKNSLSIYMPLITVFLKKNNSIKSKRKQTLFLFCHCLTMLLLGNIHVLLQFISYNIVIQSEFDPSTTGGALAYQFRLFHGQGVHERTSEHILGNQQKNSYFALDHYDSLPLFISHHWDRKWKFLRRRHPFFFLHRHSKHSFFFFF